VVLPYGEIRLRAADVAMACRDLEEAYQRKRAAMTLGDVHCHIELANWCLHNDLVGHTAEELLDAMKADPRHPMIPVLQRRLEMKLEGPPEIDEPPKPTDHDAGPTREELDRLTRQLPGHAVERFTDTIQPLLLNHCLGSGCHGTDAAGDLRFSRLRHGYPPSRRLTQQNLFNAMKFVDRQEPAASKLLTVPTKPHGPLETPIFQRATNSPLRHLAGWVGSLAERSRERRPASVTPMRQASAGTTQPEAPPSSEADGPTVGDSQADAGDIPSSTTPAATALRSGRFIQPGASSPNVQRGAPPEEGQPSDPFDPELFNQRYHAPGE